MTAELIPNSSCQNCTAEPCWLSWVFGSCLPLFCCNRRTLQVGQFIKTKDFLCLFWRMESICKVLASGKALFVALRHTLWCGRRHHLVKAYSGKTAHLWQSHVDEQVIHSGYQLEAIHKGGTPWPIQLFEGPITQYHPSGKEISVTVLEGTFQPGLSAFHCLSVLLPLCKL